MAETVDFQFRDETKEPGWVEGNIINPFVNSLVITPRNAAANVVNFVGQGELIGKAESLPVSQSEFGTAGWFAQNISAGLGAIVPYVVAGKVAGAGMRRVGVKLAAEGSGVLINRSATVMKSELAAQMLGAAAIDFARDTRPGETHLGNAAGGAAAFFVFGKGNAITLTNSFLRRQIARAGVGAVGGVTGITASSLVAGEGLPELRLLGEAAVAGGTMNLALPPLQRALSASELQTAYYRAKWTVREGYHNTRRAGYAALNRFEMRHPIDRLSDRLHGDNSLSPVKRPVLTAENNPVRVFERETPEFFKRIQAKEVLVEQTSDRRQQYEIYESMKEVRMDFGHKLLEVWHGTASKPGIKHYTDAELATTSGISPERVKQIREALSASIKADYPNPSDMTVKLGKLVGVDAEVLSTYRDSYALNEIGFSREKFWGYDEHALIQRMGMSRIHHFQDHHYNTPLDWMPFDATPELANLFHGSMSPSLASIIGERAMLPAWEMRLRGIKQRTGESANEEFPRRSISLTRDFAEAFAYHRHSPQSLSDFPIVYGISKSVIPRARTAGSLEPGEILIDRVRFGNRLFGLRKSDVTNIYVPDSEVGNIMQQLASRRIRGVQVLGFSQMPAPKWNPEPSIEQLREMYPFG